MRDSSRAKSRFASSLFFAQRFQNFLRRDRDFIYAHTNRIVNGVSDGGRHGQQWTLPNLFRAEWSVWIGIFYQVSLDVAHFHRGGTLVFEHRRKLVHGVAIRAIRHLLHQDLAETHVDAAFYLSHHQGRIDRLTNVVRNPDSFDNDNPGRRIDINFRDGCGVTVSRRWTHTRAFVFAGRAWRRV